MASSIFLTTSKVLTLNTNRDSILNTDLPPCSLKWKQKKLWVKSIREESSGMLAALKSKPWLIRCLQNSNVQIVCIDPQIGERGLKTWADVCSEAEKEAYLRICSDPMILRNQKDVCWRIKRVSDWFAALFILLLLSPVMLVIALTIKLSSPGSILFSQWRVGRRGKLFKIYKFRSMVIDAELKHHQVMGNQSGLHKQIADPRVTSFGKWLRKYSLDELPQLFNVLRGEMSLVGPRPWALYDALRLGKTSKKRLNALPGITGAWQIQGRASLLDLDLVTECDLNYLRNWNLKQDLAILLMTIPKVISGFGAY